MTLTNQLICQTERLTLQQFVIEDTAFIISLVNSPGWLEFIGDRDIHTDDQARNYLQNSLLASYQEHGYGLYQVVLKPDGIPIGMCGLVKRDSLPQPDIGFAFLPAYMGQGYAFEAATAIQKLARDQFRLPTLYAITLPTNASSSKLLEKMGMTYQGPFRADDGKELLLYRS